MDITTQSAHSLSSTQMTALSRLTTRNGYLRSWLRYIGEHYDEGSTLVIVVRDGGIIVSWALVVLYDCYQNHSYIQVYTRSTHRKRGFGTITFRSALDYCKKRGSHPMVSFRTAPWFFEKFGLTYPENDYAHDRKDETNGCHEANH